MLETTGIMGKMIIFILLVTTPVAIVGFWLASQDLLSIEYSILITLTPVGPAVLIYNRLLKEVAALHLRFEIETLSPKSEINAAISSRSGLLPVDDLLIAMRQYRRELQALLKDAKSERTDATFLFNMLPDPILVLDHKRQISLCNKAANDFFDSDDVAGDLTSYLRHPVLLKAVDTVMSGDSNRCSVEFSILGNISRKISADIINLVDKGADDFRVIVILRDQTAVKKTEQMRVDFVANASHEIRTPLAILIGAIETLQGPAAEDYQAYPRFLNMMQAQSERMSQLIDDLLSLSHIEMDEHSRPSESVDLSALLKNVIDMIGAKALKLGKTLELKLPETSFVIKGDKDQLFQVFTNLVDNALKYSRENTTIQISLSEQTGKTVVSITDQGEGIPAEHLPRLTERFYRVDSNRSRQMGGTGLGLAIVKHIVSRHRGHLEIESVVGKGSTFTIKLPST